MKISKLTEMLNKIRTEHGDIEVTCTGATLPDGHGSIISEVFETTVQTLIIKKKDKSLPKRVRLYL